MNPWCRVVLAVASISFLGASPQQQPLGETIEVSIVNLDVFVTDKSGARVRGLTPQDFEVFENGKPQAISNFAEYSGGREPTAVDAAPAATTRSEREPRRTIIVFVERFWPSPANSGFYPALKKFVRESVRPGDAALVVGWDDFMMTMTTYQKFTDDTAKLDDAIDRMKGGPWVPPGQDLGHDVLPAMTGARGEQLMSALKDRHSSMRSGASDSWILARIAFMKMKHKVATLNALVNGIGGAEGKKILVMATRRFSEVAGAEYFVGGEAGPLDGGVRAAFSTRTMVDGFIANANAHNITIYPLHPEGLEPTRMPSADEGYSIAVCWRPTTRF